jgi:hypothetical protein
MARFPHWMAHLHVMTGAAGCLPLETDLVSLLEEGSQ